MKVLFVGFFKTGTKTMNEALAVLGYRVSDIGRNFVELRDDWWKFFDGKGTPEDIRRMFEGYDAAGDSPSFVFWKDFLKAFPDLKVILTTRNEETWVKSWQNQVKEIDNSDLTFPLSVFSRGARKWHDLMGTTVTTAFKQPRQKFSVIKKYPRTKDEVCKKAFMEHNEEVTKSVPQKQLLVYSVKEGWEPLCRFLGHDIPDVPFPHLNKGGEIIAWRLKNNAFMQDMYKEMYFNIALLILLLTFGVGYFVLYW